MQNQEIDVKQTALLEVFIVISYTCVTIILTFMTLSIAFFFFKGHDPLSISHINTCCAISCYGKLQTVMSPWSNWSCDVGFNINLTCSILIWFWSDTSSQKPMKLIGILGKLSLLPVWTVSDLLNWDHSFNAIIDHCVFFFMSSVSSHKSWCISFCSFVLDATE